jgi:hypothetical protein
MSLMTARARNGLFALGLALIIGCAGASGASASVTIGQVPSSSYAPGGCANCGAFQYTVDSGTSYTVPTSGVITKFMMRSSTAAPSPTETVQFFVTRPVSGSNFLMVKNLDPLPLAGLPANTVEIFPVRVSVQPGDLIGNHWSTTTVNGFFSPIGAANTFKTAAVIQTIPSGTTFTATDALFPNSAMSRLNLQATIEPDIDGDGYGDETQDGCPTVSTAHSACAKPVVSDFKYSTNKFAVNTKGKVLSATKAAKGTTIILTLSEAAHVTIVMNLKGTGRKVGGVCVKQTSKNIKKKKCSYYPKQFHFERDLPLGTSNLGFSGRIKVGSKTKALPPGSYVATAYPFNIPSQLGGDIAKTTFKVVPAPKKH